MEYENVTPELSSYWLQWGNMFEKIGVAQTLRILFTKKIKFENIRVCEGPYL